MTARGSEMVQEVKTLEMLEHTGQRKDLTSVCCSLTHVHHDLCTLTHTVNKYNTIKSKNNDSQWWSHLTMCTWEEGQEDLDSMRIYLIPLPSTE